MGSNVFPQLGWDQNIHNPNTPISQLPYTEVDEWIVAESGLDCGVSFTFPWNTAALNRLRVTYSSISRAEVTILENFFQLMRGKLGSFSFTVLLDDGSSVTYTPTRFDQDEMTIGYPEPGRFSTEFELLVLPAGTS